MLTKFSLYNESEMNQWDNFVKSHPAGTTFHLSCWMKAIQETYALEPLLYVVKNERDEITGIVPFFLIKSPFIGSRIVSLPFSDYCGPLSSDKDQEEKMLTTIIGEHKNQVKYIEIRGNLKDNSELICHNYYKCHTLELLPDPAEVLTKLDRKTIRYGIRKAQKSEIEIREENTQSGIEEFYRLNRLTRKKHGIPSQPVKFFQKFFDHMVLSGNSYILLAIDDSKVVATGVFSKLNDTIYYKYNASDTEYLATTKKTPNHLLTWHAIEKACLEGYKFFDFGRTSPNNTGLVRYKEMWGCKPYDLPYYYYPEIKGSGSKEESSLSYRILTSAWRSLPDSWQEIIEQKIYKHIA